MTDKQTPPDWVIEEAAKRSHYEYTVDFTRNNYGAFGSCFRALCDMILKHEHPPVDRKLLCAREAITQSHDHERSYPSNICQWQWIAIRAIELWESGYGRD